MCASPRTKLIHARERLRLRSKAEFARLVGISPSYVTHVEAGRKVPTPPVVDRWVKALGRGAKRDLFEPGWAEWLAEDETAA